MWAAGIQGGTTGYQEGRLADACRVLRVSSDKEELYIDCAYWNPFSKHQTLIHQAGRMNHALGGSWISDSSLHGVWRAIMLPYKFLYPDHLQLPQLCAN